MEQKASMLLTGCDSRDPCEAADPSQNTHIYFQMPPNINKRMTYASITTSSGPRRDSRDSRIRSRNARMARRVRRVANWPRSATGRSTTSVVQKRV